MKRLVRKSNIDESLFNEKQLQTIKEAELKNIYFNTFIHPNIDDGIMELALSWLEDCKALDDNYYLYFQNKVCVNTKEAKYLIDEIKEIIEVLKTSTRHDINNRTYALVYFNGKFYEGSRHAECINDALHKTDREDLDDTDFRPTQNQISEVLIEDDVMFCAHVVEDPYKTEEYDGTNNYNSIYVMVESQLLKNITFEQIKKTLNGSREYNGFYIHLDQDSYIDYERGFRDYPLL